MDQTVAMLAHGAILVLPVFEVFSVMPWIVEFYFLWSQVTIMHGQKKERKEFNVSTAGFQKKSSSFERGEIAMEVLRCVKR